MAKCGFQRFSNIVDDISGCSFSSNGNKDTSEHFDELKLPLFELVSALELKTLWSIGKCGSMAKSHGKCKSGVHQGKREDGRGDLHISRTLVVHCIEKIHLLYENRSSH